MLRSAAQRVDRPVIDLAIFWTPRFSTILIGNNDAHARIFHSYTSKESGWRPSTMRSARLLSGTDTDMAMRIGREYSSDKVTQKISSNWRDAALPNRSSAAEFRAGYSAIELSTK